MKQQEGISTLLESEHHWIDERFQHFGEGLSRGQVEADSFREAAKTLHRHIYLEEEILFPEVEVRGLVGPTTVLVQEHGEICRFLNGIQDLIQRDAKPGRIQARLKALRSLLEEHNFKEERVLYPTADQLLDQDELSQILQRLKETNPTEDWVCRAHRDEG